MDHGRLDDFADHQIGIADHCIDMASVGQSRADQKRRT